MANWGPIHQILQEGDATYKSSMVNDARVSKKVASLLKKKDVDVMFVQLDEVDGAGHSNDYSVGSPKYLEAIEKERVTFMALPLKIEKGDGAPVRALAIEE